MDITLYATIIQIPVRVMLAYILVAYLSLSAVAIGVTLGWVCMIGYEAYEYRRYLLSEGVYNHEIGLSKKRSVLRV